MVMAIPSAPMRLTGREAQRGPATCPGPPSGWLAEQACTDPAFLSLHFPICDTGDPVPAWKAGMHVSLQHGTDTWVQRSPPLYRRGALGKPLTP